MDGMRSLDLARVRADLRGVSLGTSIAELDLRNLECNWQLRRGTLQSEEYAVLVPGRKSIHPRRRCRDKHQSRFALVLETLLRLPDSVWLEALRRHAKGLRVT